jgi:hypothetical protein
MYLIENGELNIDIEIDFNIIPNDYKNKIEAFPLISRYKDFCNLKIKLIAGTEVMRIISSIRQLQQTIQDTGYVLNNLYYDILFNVSWADMPNDIKDKMKNKTIDELYQFFGISPNDIISEGQKAFQEMMVNIGKILNADFKPME